MVNKKTPDTRLSYSSFTLLSNCEQKYWHYKVNNTDPDSDIEESTAAFDVGKTFHEVLEHSNHEDKDILRLLDKSCNLYDTNGSKLMIRAMLEKYLAMNKLSGLKAIHCELGISDPRTIGFIDVIMEDSLGYWWIVDLKTSGRWMPSILARLPMDMQLNLYASFRKGIAATLDLDLKKYAGCRYRVTTKTTIKQKAKESDEAYLNRMKGSIKSFDIIIPKKAMSPNMVSELHAEAHNRSLALRHGEIPTRNYSYCESYMKPCKYWSRCHGDLNTNTKNLVQLKDEYLYEQEIKAIEEL